MRIKSKWFKADRKHTPEELAGAAAFNISRIAENALKNMRKARFEVAVGEQYFAFLAEFLVYMIQVADRLAYRNFSASDRQIYTSHLANHVALTFAENQSRLIGGEMSARKQHFIDHLNLRSGEYADFSYDENGPEFAFNRYLAYCLEQIVDESFWITDQIMGIEAPAAVEMLEKHFRTLLQERPAA